MLSTISAIKLKIPSRLSQTPLTNPNVILASFATRGIFKAGETMGRKVSVNERAATEAFRGILKMTKNEKVKMQAAQLLLENETGNKERAVARQRQQLTNARKKEVASLRAQVDSLQKELQAANNKITALKADNEKEVDTLKQTIGKLGKQLSEAQVAGGKTKEQLSDIASYVACPEYEPKALCAYLAQQDAPQSRLAALRIVVSDDSISQDQRRKLALEITQNHKESRHQEPFKRFVDTVKNELGVATDQDLEPEYARWYRSKESDDPVLLLKLATVLESASFEEQRRARQMLALFYGWTYLDLSIKSSYLEREQVFERVRALKKRSLKEVENIKQAATQRDRPRHE
jgi:hypothetical protein